VRVLLWLARHPGWLLAPTGLGAIAWQFGAHVAGCLVGGLMIVLGGWGRAHPPSFDRWVAPRLRSMWRRWWGNYRGRRWADVLGDCELVRENRHTVHPVVPRIQRVQAVTASIDLLQVRMARGQNTQHWIDQSDTLADALGAHRVAVSRHSPGRVALVVERTMPFTTPLPAPVIPDSAAEVNFRALDIGDDEYGQPMTVPIIGGAQLLGVGATGSGKGSIITGLLRQLAPAIRDRWVRIHMIDLKGGMETEAYAPICTHRAITTGDAVELLAHVRDGMKADQERLRQAGLRKATISAETPLDLVIIDEMAMLTAYGARQAVREALNLLAEIMTQGRASLQTVAGFVQEPAKDILEVRELFTTRLCLAVTAASHVDMALGEGAWERGAHADAIPIDPEHAGIGFRMDKGTRLPRRLRIGYSTDADITELVQLATPPRHLHTVTEDTGEVA
jgi:S-DNA-T family DNA segregation ATPase FtsK/SpoIIIE